MYKYNLLYMHKYLPSQRKLFKMSHWNVLIIFDTMGVFYSTLLWIKGSLLYK